jgi:hypothetical protein
MSWQASLLKASFDTQRIKAGSVGHKVVIALDHNRLDELIKKIKSEELNLGGVRSSLNKIIRLFNQVNEQSKSMGEEQWEKQKERYEDVTFSATATDVPIKSHLFENAEKLKGMLDKLAPAQKVDGKRNKKYKDKVPKKVLNLYEKFLSGDFQPLVDYLNEGSQDAKKTKIKRLRLWDKENNRFVKALKSAKANKARLMGYDTLDVKLLLPDDFNYDILPKAWEQEEQAEGVLVSLPSWITILQGKKLSGGQPSKPITRNFFAKVFNQPKYSGTKIAASSEVNIKGIEDDLALGYLRHVLTKVSGQDRVQFLPNLLEGSAKSGFTKRINSLLFGIGTGHQWGTAKVLPLLEYIFNENKIDIDAGFATNTTKESLTKDAVYRKLNRGGVDEKYQDIIDMFENRMKKKGDSTGFAKFELDVRAAGQETVKLYEELKEETPVIPSGLSIEMRDFLLKPPRGGWKKKPNLQAEYGAVYNALPNGQAIKTMRFGETIYGDRKQTDDKKRVGELHTALERMKPSKQDSQTLVPSNKGDADKLRFLFSSIDYNPIATLREAMSKGNDGEFSPGTRYVELTLRDTNQLTFVFLIQVLIRLEKTLLKQDNIRDAVRKATKVKRVYDDESKQWVAGKPPTAEDMTQMETKLEETINRVYPQIRDRILDATKKKIVEVMEEPIVIDKEGVAQPLHWLKERPGL